MPEATKEVEHQVQSVSSDLAQNAQEETAQANEYSEFGENLQSRESAAINEDVEREMQMAKHTSRQLAVIQQNINTVTEKEGKIEEQEQRVGQLKPTILRDQKGKYETQNVEARMPIEQMEKEFFLKGSKIEEQEAKIQSSMSIMATWR